MSPEAVVVVLDHEGWAMGEGSTRCRESDEGRQRFQGVVLYDQLNRSTRLDAVAPGYAAASAMTPWNELLAAASEEEERADDLVNQLVADSAVGVEVALAVLAPRLQRATGRLHAWTGEDVGELIAAARWERLQRGALPPRPSRSVVSQARKHVVRQLRASWKRAQSALPILDHVLASPVSVEEEAIDRMAEAGPTLWQPPAGSAGRG